MVPHSQHVFWAPESAVWLIFVPWAALAAAWSTRAQSAPALPPLLLKVLGALVLCWILSALFAERRDIAAVALGEWLGYPLLFFATWRLAVTPRRRALALALLFAYGVLSTLYAGLQAAGGDQIAWATTFGGRAGAFLGNPNFLGGHLALLFPVSLALALDQRQAQGLTWRRWMPWALVITLGVGLLLAQTRGAWAGAALGSALVLGLAGKQMGELLVRNRKPLLSLGGAALLGLAAFFVLQPGAWSRLTGTFSHQDGELSRRFFLMKKASQISSLRPLTGAGPGNFRIQFPRVQVLGLATSDYKSQPYVQTEHAHNDFLQMAADAGVPAALLWAALMALVLWQLYQVNAAPRLARGPAQGGLLALGVLGGLSALLVHGLANFPFLILPTQGTAWVLAALALRSSARAAGTEASDGLVDGPAAVPKLAPEPSRLSALAQQRLSVSALVLGVVLCCGNTVYQGWRLNKDRFWWIGQGELALNHADLASTGLLRAIELDRREDRLWMLHGRAEIERGMIWNSIGSLREAHRLAPYDPEISVRLGRSLVENQQYPEAETVLRSASQNAPNFYDVWEPLAAALYMQSKYEEAVQAYDWMIYFETGGENAYVNKAAALGSQGKLPQSLLTLKEAERRYPDKAKVFQNEVVTYVKLGMPGEARLALKKAESLSPHDPQILQLRKALR